MCIRDSLHYVPWPKSCTYGEIVLSYSSFVKRNYGRNSVVVFDGYPECCSTKEEEQNRRSARRSSCKITFDENTTCVTPKEDFLANKNNKKQLTLSVVSQLQKEEIKTVESEGDADVDIVQEAIGSSNTNCKVYVVGSDTDLLVLLVSLCPENCNIFFLKHKPGKTKVCYGVQQLINEFEDTRKLLLFAYAVTGCDTTSSFFGIGKVKAIEKIRSSNEARAQALVFTQEHDNQDELLRNGEQFILSLYGMTKYSSLNEARYFMFTRLTNSQH